MAYEEDCLRDEAKLKRFIDENNLEAEIVLFSESVHSTETSKKALGLGPEKVLKSIVIKSGDFLVCILRGSEKVDFKKLRNLLGVKNIRTALPEEVLKATGYVVGGVPPFSYKTRFFIDKTAIDTLDPDEIIYAGGGSPRALLKTKLKEILKATNAEIADFSMPK